MYTELLIALPIYFIVINIAIIVNLAVIRHKPYKYTAAIDNAVVPPLQRQFILCDSVIELPGPVQPLMLSGITPDYNLAQSFINKLNRLVTIKNKLTTQYESVYNYDHLLDYLSIHLVKYPCGVLPKQPGTITYYDNKAQYTMTFYDSTEPKIEKYIKEAMRLLKTKKTKQLKLNIVKEANKIVKSKGKRTKVLTGVS